MSFRGLLVWVRARPPKAGRETHLVAVDGHGGAGKSTFAARLAAAGDRVDVVHTDDFALPGETAGLDIVRLCEQVLAPLERDEVARYQRLDWESQQLVEWIDVRPGGLVVLEGVSSMRREFTVPWDLTVWVETPRDLCLARGLERDGAGARHLWDRWLAQEDEYISRDEPHVRADLVVAGSPDDAPSDPASSLRCAERPAARAGVAGSGRGGWWQSWSPGASRPTAHDPAAPWLPFRCMSIGAPCRGSSHRCCPKEP